MVESPSRRWHVAQAGAREHYAVARAFQHQGQLARLYTASWCRRGSALLRRGPSALRAMAGRHHPDVPAACVQSFDLGSIGWALHRRVVARPVDVDAIYRWEIDNSQWFARRVRKAMRKQTLDAGRDCFFGYQSECLEVLEDLKRSGVMTVIDLAGPGQVEDRLVAKEAERWPGWAKVDPVVPSFYYDRVLAECRTADLALVNSTWSRKAWIEQGVPDDKIIVVPLAYEPAIAEPANRMEHGRPLSVLWLGSVILRKGIQYLMEAARQLQGTSIRFVVAGPIGIAPSAVSAAPSNMQFLGRITRDQTDNLYRAADVFVIPTVSDGFAITQLEAMAQGVPVIATFNCGDVVSDGIDGLRIAACDAAVLAEAIRRLDGDRKLLSRMSERAVEKSRRFGLKPFADLVNAAVDRHRSAVPIRAAVIG